MPAGTNYKILTPTLRINEQTWLMFPLYVLFIINMFQFIKHEQL